MVLGEVGFGHQEDQTEQDPHGQEEIEVPLLELHDLEVEEEKGRIEGQELGKVRALQVIAETDVEQGGAQGKKEGIFMQPPIRMHRLRLGGQGIEKYKTKTQEQHQMKGEKPIVIQGNRTVHPK